MRFRKPRVRLWGGGGGGGAGVSHEVQPRSIYILAGEARTEWSTASREVSDSVLDYLSDARRLAPKVGLQKFMRREVQLPLPGHYEDSRSTMQATATPTQPRGQSDKPGRRTGRWVFHCTVIRHLHRSKLQMVRLDFSQHLRRQREDAS